MLSVIIPTEGVEQSAVATLAALVPGAAAGVIKEVLLVDRAGTGVIERVADVAGCR
ncbi:MAG: glycosyl transferase, partial [Bradyrhizobium sp.]